ncbi:DUF4440 domain-containing protein [Curtobacterium sp. MCPF17_003]|nr:DUF4440 domain-containing protein [Curtobacterium sp. MCPF17_003]
MQHRDTDALEQLLDPDARFVHMGATFTTAEELDVIRTGYIQTRHVETHDASARIFGHTAIVLNRITLTAVVDGNEVTNPFVVTEVYTRDDVNTDTWTLVNLSFTRLLTPNTPS